MNSPADTTSEPSIEEILDSIRQIIADDEGGEEPPAKAAAPPPPPPAQKPAPKKQDDDIIELTERVPEKKAAPPEPEPEAMQIDMQEAESDPFSDPDTEPEPYVPMSQPLDNLESIITQKAEAAAARAFSELTQKASIEKGGGVTIEDVVRYEIRPLLRAWIDKYLPGMVERLVQKELERIARRFDQD